MQHRAFAQALAALAGILAAGFSYASAADPSGIWAKEDGSAKMEVKKCGRGICSNIVWLKNPEDSRGRALRDARNENSSMRNRPIVGLALFINMVAIDSNSWQGSVYNPEEGAVDTLARYSKDVELTDEARMRFARSRCLSMQMPCSRPLASDGWKREASARVKKSKPLPSMKP